ncbi:Thioredoxin- transmembrane protein 1, variant 2 [Dermatophagoides farinae]|uniref:Thioredoxin- transmembrane protein 1 n=1 Tax=Dermatophagoides farinae TaxID=6954 RepID=A0A922IAU8_DERFA|nr:Thioredoxin- transmembrane protein 1 [Dermatophagoides farinae]KAH9527414.1 Thioredoxin- transmembrane protein 1, variant 2 [Dermatophagoides farinae]
MWHEARKHEKKIRGIMIDHRRRAEKRREFYESIRRDPASYLQIHGQQMKIHIDPLISQAAESSLVPWMGDQNNMIDRFDVRANLDCIPSSADVGTNDNDEGLLTSDQECQLNYERFRNLVQNDFVDNNEQKVLHKIFLKEKWGEQQQQTNNVKTKNELKKKLAEKKSAIGYNYDDNDGKSSKNDDETSSESGDDSDDEEFEDLDTIVFVDQLDLDMCERVNIVAKKYGIKSGAFMKFMQADKAEADRLRIAKEIENEKSMFVGRKSRRERKVLIQQQSNKKKLSEKSKQIPAKQISSNQPLIYGPTLPVDVANSKVDSNIRFNHTSNSNVKNRRCFREANNDEKFTFDRSPSYTIRRSPSVRRRYSSDDANSSDESMSHRSRSSRRRLSPPSRYRSRSRSHSRSHNYRRSRSKSPRRRKTSYRKRSRSKSPIRRSDRPSSRHRDHKQKQKSPNQSLIPIKTNDVKLETNDDNMKLYKLLEKIESNAKKCRRASSRDRKSEKTDEIEAKSQSESKSMINLVVEKEKSPPIKRYYRHDLVDSQSGDDHSDDPNIDSDEKKSNLSVIHANSSEPTKHSSLTNLTPSAASKSNSSSSSSLVITPQERLKRLMKAQLDKQCLYYYMKYEFLNFNIIINFKLDKLDKKAENDRLERRKIEQRERKEEFDKLSRRNRRSPSRSSDSSRSSRSSFSSYSNSDSSYDRRKRYHSRSRSRSRSKSRHGTKERYRRQRSRSRSITPHDRRHYHHHHHHHHSNHSSTSSKHHHIALLNHCISLID